VGPRRRRSSSVRSRSRSTSCASGEWCSSRGSRRRARRGERVERFDDTGKGWRSSEGVVGGSWAGMGHGRRNLGARACLTVIEGWKGRLRRRVGTDLEQSVKGCAGHGSLHYYVYGGSSR
jgi:hypothetical protein